MVKLPNPDKPRQGEEAGERWDGCWKYLRERQISPESQRGKQQLLAVTHASTPAVRSETFGDDAAPRTWLYLRIAGGCDMGQVYLGSREIKAELASAISAVTKESNARERCSGDGSQIAIYAKGLAIMKGC